MERIGQISLGIVGRQVFGVNEDGAGVDPFEETLHNQVLDCDLDFAGSSEVDFFGTAPQCPAWN